MLEVTIRKVVSFTELCRVTDMDREFRTLFFTKNFGNQVFTNDSYYCYILSSVNGEPLTDLEQIMVDLCGDAVYNDTILFEVCW